MSNATAVAPDRSAAVRLSRAELGRLFVVTGQLAALVFLIRALQVVSPGFGNLMVLALGGFVVHALLPLRYRLPFFLALSVAGIRVVLGNAAMLWIVGLGLPLVGICYLRLRFAVRLGLLGALVAGYMVLRTGMVSNAVPTEVWPVLGSMFMVRLFLYLYDLSHAAAPPPASRALSYFFLLPNVCMPMFPAVDFKAFERNYFDTEAYRIYQRGLHWIARGLLQIVVYRLVYHHLKIDALEVVDAGDLLQYVLTSFMLYLRLSGTFHIAIGVLHLFGFHLPESNHLYWLSASFTDLFRRTNIYWRDAMMKLVYYPVVFRLKGRSPAVVTTVSLVMVFIATWAGHSWIWFWLRGTPLLTLQDGAFYVVLGSLITYQAVRDQKKARVRAAVPRWSWRRGVSVCLTMGTLCLVWSYWSADSVNEWWTVWGAALVWTPRSVVMLLGAIAAGVGLGGARFGVMEQVKPRANAAEDETRKSLLITIATIAALAVLANPAVPARLSEAKRDFVMTLRENRLNRKDASTLLQGYYEQLDLGGAQNNALVEADAQRRREGGGIESSALWSKSATPMGGGLAPNLDTLWAGAAFQTNAFGLRDGPYALVKPPRTLRIAVVGPSDVMGRGVANAETFENVLEVRLNQANDKANFDRIEVLNFGVSGAGLWQRAWILDNQVAPFDCDLALFAFHPGVDRSLGIVSLERMLRAGIDPLLPEVHAFLDSMGAPVGSNMAANLKGLTPGRDAFLDLSLRLVAESSRARHLPVVLFLLRQPTEDEPGAEEGKAVARKYSLPVIDMMDFEREDETRMRISEVDKHPSVAGHAYLADRLFRELGRAGYLERWGINPAAPAP